MLWSLYSIAVIIGLRVLLRFFEIKKCFHFTAHWGLMWFWRQKRSSFYMKNGVNHKPTKHSMDKSWKCVFGFILATYWNQSNLLGFSTTRSIANVSSNPKSGNYFFHQTAEFYSSLIVFCSNFHCPVKRVMQGPPRSNFLWTYHHLP
jgi:hypothetical protein